MQLDEPKSLEYPKAKYHATEPVRVARDAEEDAALGPEWVNSPNDLVKPSLAEPKRRGRPPKVQVATE